MGTRHAKLLQKNYKHDLFAFRTYRGQIHNSLSITNISSWNEFEDIRPDIAFITNPTFKHIETATECAKRGCSLFIEKPIGSSIRGLDSLLELVRSNNLSTYVAYNLRFHPIIDYLKKTSKKNKLIYLRAVSSSYLPKWRPDQNYKKSYSASLKLGGGVILDLSHEIDYINYLLGSINNISGQFDRLTDLTIDSEDYANILVQSNNQLQANIHINFASHCKNRMIVADFNDFSLQCDLINGVIKKYSEEKLIEEKEIKVHYNYTYEQQLDYFFSNMSQNMMNNIFKASDLFKKIINFKEN